MPYGAMISVLFFIIGLCQADIAFIPFFGILFRLFKQSFCRIREGAFQGSKPGFAHEEIAEVCCRRFRIERERILALFLEFRIVSPQMPVSGFDSPFFFQLALSLAYFQTMVDA